MFALAERCTLRPILRANVLAPVAPALVTLRRSMVARGLADNASHTVSVIAQLAEDNTAAIAAAATTATAAADATSNGRGSGPFDFLADIFEAILKILDGALETAHVPYSYGFSIIILTILVKALTFPLSQQQVKSTVAMQALQPSVKEIQAKYAGDPDTLNMETARLYREAGVNPLAGCLPTLATIPVFIGLYKSLTNAAEDGLLQEDFFWIPSLAGPTTMEARQAGGGMDWLFPFVDGHPPIGWGTAAAYLVMPVLLVISQYASQKIMQPPQAEGKEADAANQTQAILKFLPLMIGWFSLNVPSGLTLYWFVNNILSTAQQVYLKANTKVTVPSAQPVAASTSQIIVKPKEERSKKTKKSTDADTPAPRKDSRGKGDKFRARKARDTASKAAQAAQATVASSPTEPPAASSPTEPPPAEEKKQ